jgi:hypothetical protein
LSVSLINIMKISIALKRKVDYAERKLIAAHRNLERHIANSTAKAVELEKCDLTPDGSVLFKHMIKSIDGDKKINENISRAIKVLNDIGKCG